jgi:hypothetical protein
MLGALGVAAAALAGAAAHAHAAEIIVNDVWVDNASEHAGPFHDDDRQLSCAPITVTGARFEHSGGAFEIVLQRPTGKDQRVLLAAWRYDRGRAGSQLLDTVSGAGLVARARALGVSPHGAAGYHLAFRFLQEPHQHKQFWVSAGCPVKAAAVAPPPAAVVPPPAPAAVPAPAPPRAAVKAAAVTPPRTGADLPYAGAALLVLAGAGCLGVARRLRLRWRGISRG